MTVKLRKAALATECPPDRPLDDLWLTWIDPGGTYDGATAMDVPLLVQPDDDRGRPVSPYGPAFVARLYYVDAAGAYLREIPLDAVVTWTWTTTPSVDIKVIAPDGSRTAVVMPPHSADALDGSGNYFGVFDGQNFLPVDFEITAHVLIDGVEVPDLVVAITFIKSV